MAASSGSEARPEDGGVAWQARVHPRVVRQHAQDRSAGSVLADQAAGQCAPAWRMCGEVQQPATYPQARPHMTAVCKTVASTFPQLLVRRAVTLLLSSLRAWSWRIRAETRLSCSSAADDRVDLLAVSGAHGQLADRWAPWPQTETLGGHCAQVTTLSRTFPQVKLGGQGRGRTAGLPLFSSKDDRPRMSAWSHLPDPGHRVAAGGLPRTNMNETGTETRTTP
jgi:hypothetical protein